LPCPCCPTHPLYHCVAHANCIFHWLPIRQRVTFKLAGLVFCSLHEASPTYLSFFFQTIHQFDLLLKLVSELHLLLETTDLPDHEVGTLQNYINLLPLCPRSDPDSYSSIYFNSSITGHHVNYAYFLSDVKLDFVRATNMSHYITIMLQMLQKLMGIELLVNVVVGDNSNILHAVLAYFR